MIKIELINKENGDVEVISDYGKSNMVEIFTLISDCFDTLNEHFDMEDIEIVKSILITREEFRKARY